jgi:hypothetical protein
MAKVHLQKLSDNSRKASLWTLKGAQNVARGAVSRPFVLQTQALEGARTIYQTVSLGTWVNRASLEMRQASLAGNISVVLRCF